MITAQSGTKTSWFFSGQNCNEFGEQEKELNLRSEYLGPGYGLYYLLAAIYVTGKSISNLWASLNMTGFDLDIISQTSVSNPLKMYIL